MTGEAYDHLLGIFDEAINLAEDAVKAAESRRVETPKVTLVKVASSRAKTAAAALLPTGAFAEHNAASLSQAIEDAGPTEFLDMLEKLASSAIFPVDAASLLADPAGDLVEKPASTGGDGSDRSRLDIWFDACAEAGLIPR